MSRTRRYFATMRFCDARLRTLLEPRLGRNGGRPRPPPRVESIAAKSPQSVVRPTIDRREALRQLRHDPPIEPFILVHCFSIYIIRGSDDGEMFPRPQKLLF